MFVRLSRNAFLRVSRNEVRFGLEANRMVLQIGSHTPQTLLILHLKCCENTVKTYVKNGYEKRVR